MSLGKPQYEGFSRFFEKPTREGLRDLIKSNIGETDYLDFKTEWPEYPKLAKHILALSNSGGGAIITGVKQNEDGTIESVGSNEIGDKEKITKGIKAYRVIPLTTTAPINRRTSRSRGLLFYRLVQQAVNIAPVTAHDIRGGKC